MHRVIRKVKGKHYEYLEQSYRVLGKRTPRKRSIYMRLTSCTSIIGICGLRR